MEDALSFEVLDGDQALANAPQDPTTNALVQNPFAWDDSDAAPVSDQ